MTRETGRAGARPICQLIRALGLTGRNHVDAPVASTVDHLPSSAYAYGRQCPLIGMCGRLWDGLEHRIAAACQRPGPTTAPVDRASVQTHL